MFAASLSFWTGLGACATATLAFVTLWVVVLTRRALTESRKEVQEAHRPVVVPLNDNREIPVVLGAAGHPQERARPFGSHESLYLPVENIGSGPALDVLVRVWALDGPGARLEVEVSGLGVQRPVSVSIRWPELGAGAPTFAFELVYADVWPRRCGRPRVVIRGRNTSASTSRKHRTALDPVMGRRPARDGPSGL